MTIKWRVELQGVRFDWEHYADMSASREELTEICEKGFILLYSSVFHLQH